MTLYELTEEFRQLLEMAEEGELDEQAIRDTLEAVGAEIEDKADGYARVIKQLEAEAAGLKTEIDRLTSRKRTAEENASRLKKTLEAAMMATGKTKFKTKFFSFGIQKNRPSVVVVDEQSVPEAFRIQQPDKIDKKGIEEYLKNAGDQFWAFMQQTESLRIR